MQTSGSNNSPQHDSRKSSAAPSRHCTAPALNTLAPTAGNEPAESSQNPVSLLHATRPKSLEGERSGPSTSRARHREEEGNDDDVNDDDLIYVSRGRRPAFYHSHSESKSKIYQPRMSQDPSPSRSRSASRPPRAMELHGNHAALDPVTTRVSVSVDPHTGSSMRTYQRDDDHYKHRQHKSVELDRNNEHEDEEYISRYRSTVPGRVVGRSRVSNSESNSNPHSQSRSRSRATELSHSSGPVTPQDREPILGHGYPYHHHNGYRPSKFELGLEQHAEGT